MKPYLFSLIASFLIAAMFVQCSRVTTHGVQIIEDRTQQIDEAAE